MLELNERRRYKFLIIGVTQIIIVTLPKMNKVMTREEFSKELKAIRTIKNVPTYRICAELSTYESVISGIERGTTNYRFETAVKYVNAVNAEIVFTFLSKKYVITSSETAVEVLKNARLSQSVYSVAKATGYTTSALYYMESLKGGLSIDMLLKLSYYYGIEITIRSK